MSEDLKNNFDKLALEQKKNQISDELVIIGELIRQIEKIYGVECLLNIKNYNVNNKLNDSQTLTFIYEDIYNIQKELVVLLTVVNLKNNENNK